MENPSLKWMIWRYQHLRKHPNMGKIYFNPISRGFLDLDATSLRVTFTQEVEAPKASFEVRLHGQNGEASGFPFIFLVGFRRDPGWGCWWVDGFCDLLVVHLDLFTSSFFVLGRNCVNPVKYEVTLRVLRFKRRQSSKSVGNVHYLIQVNLQVVQWQSGIQK